MIKLERGPAPDFYRSKKFFDLNERLQEEFENSTRQHRLNFNLSFNPQIKEALMHYFYQKCVYCETRLDAAEQATIDPFRPRNGARGLDNKKYAPDHYWWLAYDWDNMMLSRNTCNTKYKRDLFPLTDERLRAEVYAVGDMLLREEAPLIDPCIEHPEEHLKFEDNGMVVPHTPKGKATIEILGLNRSGLVRQRGDKARELHLKLKILALDKDANKLLAESLIPYIEEIFLGSAEYSAVLREVFKSWYKYNFDIWDRFQTGPANKSYLIKSHHNDNYTDALMQFDSKFDELKRFSIKSFTITNFRSIDYLDIKLLPSSNNKEESLESWSLILGDNGIGKSSILQALSLALCGEKQARKLNLDAAEFLKRGTPSGSVIIESYESETAVEPHFDAYGFKSNIQEAPTFVMAYGATRSSPKGLIEPDKSKEPYSNVRSLFDYTVALEDPKQWLNELAEEEFRDRVVPAFYDVLALSESDTLYREDGEIKIRRFNDDHILGQTSDGYKTIVAVVSDIMQTLSRDLAGYHNSSGIVIIDEIGNHLHPRWRTKIVKALRRAFPKIQFIVTTHEPLCLRGLEHGEVVVMVRDEEHNVKCLTKEFLPDHSAMSVEQLLTSDLFGPLDVLDCDVEKSFEEYYALLSRGRESWDADEKRRFEELKAEIKRKEPLGGSPRDQVYYEAIDDVFAKSIREDGFKVKEVLKKKHLRWLKE
ncbi:AAA family ATPase [Flavobacterium sp. P21]|uniref:AAA family ATPase n=1 Tax=Flavobacterium sp. P21 TaxID=3423948 RepID=UPI003D669146